MQYQINQFEKSQALDLLDRVADWMLAVQRNGMTDDEIDAHSDATDVVLALYRRIDAMKTQLDARPTELSVAEFASLIESYENARCHRSQNAVDYFARYFSNYNTDELDFKLAAGATLPFSARLLSDEENF